MQDADPLLAHLSHLSSTEFCSKLLRETSVLGLDQKQYADFAVRYIERELIHVSSETSTELSKHILESGQDRVASN